MSSDRRATYTAPVFSCWLRVTETSDTSIEAIRLRYVVKYLTNRMRTKSAGAGETTFEPCLGVVARETGFAHLQHACAHSRLLAALQRSPQFASMLLHLAISGAISCPLC